VSEAVTASPAGDEAERPRWGAFSLVCLAYLAVTVGEQVLSPVFPKAADEFGLTSADGGLAFGLLAGSIAVANLVGGVLLQRLGSARLVALSAAVTAAGSIVAAMAPSFGVLVAAQLLLGLGAGLFFPAGLQAVAILAGPRRKGFAMGIYGVAFSAGLTLAAVLGAVGAADEWRLAFWVSAGLALIAVAVSASGLRVTAAPRPPGSPRVSVSHVLGLATAVGSVGAICQYGAIPFLTTFAVVEWGMAEASAALLLAIGRVVSIVAKLVGGASADRVGPRASVRRTGLVLVATGLAWVLLPAGIVTYGIAAIFAGTVSSLFPAANLLAVERFGQHGTALGAYRSVQVGIGAAAGALIGFVGDAVGLRPTLTIAVLSPLALLWWCREPKLPHA
jgi:MFS transporter, DHA1 family, inner membrane transport protein